jgi:hypothetical protein
VTWGVDFTTTARSLDSEVVTTIIDTLVEGSELGPPHSNQREIAGITFYESVIAERFLIAFTIDDSRRRFASCGCERDPARVRRRLPRPRNRSVPLAY